MDDFQKWFLTHSADKEADKILKGLADSFESDDFSLSSEGFETFKNRLQKEKKTARRATIRKWVRHMERAAAILLIPLAVALAVTVFHKEKPVEWSEVYTLTGQSRSVTLSDGSTLKLAPGSRLVYPSSFSGDVRKVFLEGEAYADITHIDGYPFEIHSNDITVTVFGTEFNFSSYLGDSECELALVEGSVEMKIEGKDSGHTIRMRTGDMVRYERATGSVEKQRFSTDVYLANVHREGLQFPGRRLDDIARSLERVFGSSIIIEDASLADERFYASFINGEGLNDILSSLNIQNHMNIKKKGNVYYLSNKK